MSDQDVADVRRPGGRTVTEQNGNNKPNEAEGLAFPLSGNEKLIEEAAKAMHADDLRNGRAGDEFASMNPETQDWYRDNARAALAVFEKAHTTTPPDGWFYMGSHVGAPWLNLEFSEEMDETGLPLWERPVQHTPTDDEREALESALYEEGFSGSGEEIGTHETVIFVEHVPDIVARLGFHRSEVPEPSAEGPAFIAIMPPSPETSKRWYSMYCRVCGIEEMMAGTADDPRLLARRDEHNRERHAEPQGEPSDARAKVIDALVMTRLSDFAGTDMGVIEQAADAVLAALRAAGGAR